MNSHKLINSLTKLREYCEKEDFKGWDPYDGLNSKVFQAIPLLKNSALVRLVVIQGFKRFSINLRKIALVPKEYNAKGVGLFLSGYCNLYKAIERGYDLAITKEYCLEKINYLAELLISLQSKGYSGACWGYNFDWQSRAFFLPKYTPTVVATSFAVEALISAYEITKNEAYIKTAISSASFIENDLNRIEKQNGLFMFSYSPRDKQAVYNATLLGSKTLSLIYKYTDNEQQKSLARKSVEAVCCLQNSDGSFPHSDQVGQTWRDSFHTGFKLESIKLYSNLCGDNQFDDNISSGLSYWLDNYFDKSSGFSYYYDRGQKTSLVDLHCVAQALSTLSKLEIFNQNKELADKIAEWAIDNMQSSRGYFYFQKVGNSINKSEYMRWPNAWMFYGLSYYLNMYE